MSKLSPGTLILGIFAVLFGLVGAYTVKRYLQQTPEAPAEVAAVQQQIVPLAGADLSAGRTIAMGDVMLVRMSPEEMRNRKLPANFMTNAKQIIGRTLREPVKQSEAFVLTRLYPEGTGPSVAEHLKPGYRAMTITLEDEAAQTAMVSPGTVVDVLFRSRADEKKHLPETTLTLLERVEVLAVGQETFEGARSAQDRNQPARRSVAVTVAVTLEQANALKVVEGRGSISLALRGPEDKNLANRAGAQTLAGLLQIPQPEKPFVTQVYRGGRLSTSVFENGQQSIVPQISDGLPVRTETTSARSAAGSIVLTAGATTDPSPQKPCGCGGK
jgi:Flp pilus assembly protein CpaB